MSPRIAKPFAQKCLKDLPVALVSTLLGLFVLVCGTGYWHAHDLYFLNYREEGLIAWPWLIKPAFLMMWGVMGGITGLMAQLLIYPVSDFAFISS